LKEHVNLVFIGHVDHGKSTLCGRILFDLGLVDERTVQKCKELAKENHRESWSMAYYVDENDEERRRGITVEFARARFESSKKRYAILDAPGHRNYIPMMIEGAAQADVAILVISARSNEFESGFQRNGQTREHIILAKTLGIHKVVVVVNKMDDDTVSWSQARFDQIKKSVSSFLGSVGFPNAPFVPLSGFSGINIAGDVIQPSWYGGSSLVTTLDDLPPIPRNTSGPFILPINLVDTEHGHVHVSGKVESGTLHVDSDLIILPGSYSVHVTTIYPHYGSSQTTETAPAGENVRITLDKAQMEHVRRGAVLCSMPDALSLCTMFSAEIKIINLPVGILTAGYKAILHIHCEAIECSVKAILYEYDKNGNKVKANRFVKSGARIEAVLEVSRQVVMAPYQNVIQLGRFTLRVGGETIGFGKVLKCKPV